MKRVLIIGCPGSGKTYLSRDVAKATGLPLVHLDKIYHDKAFNYHIDTDIWRARIQQELDKPEWIIEGNYTSSLDMRLPPADMVIFLDYARNITLYRAVKRQRKYRNTPRDDMPEGWKEQLNRQFLKSIVTFRKVQRPIVLDLLKKNAKGKEIVILKNPKATKAYVAKHFAVER
jgi:adenylate kinase family enzyme